LLQDNDRRDISEPGIRPHPRLGRHDSKRLLDRQKENWLLPIVRRNLRGSHGEGAPRHLRIPEGRQERAETTDGRKSSERYGFDKLR